MTPCDALLGAWNLESLIARDVAAGEERRPLGDDPRGPITYTGHGHMSAQLARTDTSSHVAYVGRFVVDESASTVRHDVTMSTMPDLLTASQLEARRSRWRPSGVVGDHHRRAWDGHVEHAVMDPRRVT